MISPIRESRSARVAALRRRESLSRVQRTPFEAGSPFSSDRGRPYARKPAYAHSDERPCRSFSSNRPGCRRGLASGNGCAIKRIMIFPRITDAPLRHMPLLKDLGKEIPETRVQTLGIIVYLDVLEIQASPGLGVSRGVLYGWSRSLGCGLRSP